MNKFISIIIGRTIIRVVGMNIRFAYYALIGKPKTKDDLFPIVNEDNSNLDYVVKSDFINSVVGYSTLLVLILLAKILLY